MLTLHHDENNVYTWMCDYFLGHLVGSVKFCDKCLNHKLSEFVKIIDEAFVILTIENNEDAWRDQVDQDIRKSKVPRKYTDGGKCSKQGRSHSLHGWDNAGLLRFNLLFDIIAKDRKLEGRSMWEINYMQHRQEKLQEHNNSLKRPKQRVKTYTSDVYHVASIRDEMDD